MFPDPALSHLLARWHGWRRDYTHERKLSRVAVFADDCGDEDDRLETMQMETLESEIARLPHEMQLALQHVARAEFLGAEVLLNPRLGDKVNRERLVVQALRELESRLRYLDLL